MSNGCIRRCPAAHPLDGADAALVYRDVGRTADGLGRDARAWRATHRRARLGRANRSSTRCCLRWDLPRAPLAAARYGIAGALPATVLARGAFRTDAARAVFAGMAAHSVLEPATGRSPPDTACCSAALAHSVGWPVVRGGSQVLADALAERGCSGKAARSTPEPGSAISASCHRRRSSCSI